jgi:FtsH-binding integral membrane protein
MFEAVASAAAIPLIAIAAAGLFYGFHRGADSSSERVIFILVPVWPVLAFCGVLVVSEIQSPSDSGASRILWWLSLAVYVLILILATRRNSSDDPRMISFLVAAVAGVALLMIASMVAWGDWP